MTVIFGDNVDIVHRSRSTQPSIPPG